MGKNEFIALFTKPSIFCMLASSEKQSPPPSVLCIVYTPCMEGGVTGISGKHHDTRFLSRRDTNSLPYPSLGFVFSGIVHFIHCHDCGPGSSVGYFSHTAWRWGCSCEVQRKLVLWWNMYGASSRYFSLDIYSIFGFLSMLSMPQVIKRIGKASVDYMQVLHHFLRTWGAWRLSKSRCLGTGHLVGTKGPFLLLFSLGTEQKLMLSWKSQFNTLLEITV